MILSFLVPGAMLMAQSHNYDAPDQVRVTFNKQYPKAEKTHWSRNGSQWTANFRDDEHGEMYAHYNKNGDHLESRIPYSQSDVPGPVRDMVKQRYPHGRDHEYTKIERNHGNDQFYQVRVSERDRKSVV